MSEFLTFTLDQLTMFVAVVDSGTFAEASARLGRAQSAVSASIAKLERALDTPLFDRTGRRSVLTDEGRRLASEARLVLAQAREVDECAVLMRESVEASLAVAVDAIFPRTVLFEAARAFHVEFPRVPLRIYEDTMSRPWVERGQAALGICNLVGDPSPDLVVRPCRTVRLVPVCAREHPLAAIPAPQPEHELRRSVQLVLSERGEDEYQPDLGVLSARTWRVTDLQTKLGLLRSGVGWGSMPEDMVARDLDGGSLVRLYPMPWPDGHAVALHVVVRASQPMGVAGRWLMRALSEPSFSPRSADASIAGAPR